MIVYNRAKQEISFTSETGTITKFEARSDFFPGFNSLGQARESLPNGNYVVNAERPGLDYGPGFGLGYINTGDPRWRDIHGGGSDLPDPYAPRQGWEATYGCLRMQNMDILQLSQLIINAGNTVEMIVQDGDNDAA